MSAYRFRLAIPFLGLLFLSGWAQIPCADFEIVESIPIETILDNPEIRNTSEVWTEMIGAADETIDIEQYYVSNTVDEPLESIIKLIEQARDAVLKPGLCDARMAKTYRNH